MITYYWPPSAGAGVYRWVRMSKYFAENGIDLTVFHPENAAYPTKDKHLLKQIPDNISTLSLPILEPGNFMKSYPTSGTGLVADEKVSLKKRFSVWVRGNLFIPDARMLWIKPSTKFLRKYIEENGPFDHVISSGPPHSMHLIAKNLKRHFNFNWVADFRDPWTGIDFYQDLNIGPRADKKQRRLERAVLQEADKVITVSSSIQKELEDLGAPEVDVVTNGYIFDFDFTPNLDEQFTISHFGTMNKSRNPELLWKALSELLPEYPELASKLNVQLYGSVDPIVLKTAKDLGLEKYLTVVSQVPHHESIEAQRNSQLLLLVVNNTGNISGTLTGKFFEYLAAKRPILTIGPEQGDLAEVLKKTETGTITDYEKVEEFKAIILRHFEAFKKGTLSIEPKHLEPYSSGFIARNLCASMRAKA